MDSPRPGFSLAKRLRSFGYAWAGLRYFIRSEHNAWIHVGATFAVLALSAALGLRAEEWLWIVLAIGWVWTAEAFNTAIERLADCVTLERTESIKAVKDVAAAGVLVSAIGAFVIGILIFYPHLRAFFD